MSHTIDNKVENTQINGVPQGKFGLIKERGSSNPTTNVDNSKNNSFYNKFRRGAGVFLLGVSLIGLAGCATVDPTNAGVHWKFPRDPTGPNIEYLIVEYKNDIYLRKQRQTPWSYDFEDRQLTHTLNVKETDVRVWDNGEVTYFAHEPDSGHWYSQPLSGDDSNRTRLDRAPGR